MRGREAPAALRPGGVGCPAAARAPPVLRAGGDRRRGAGSLGLLDAALSNAAGARSYARGLESARSNGAADPAADAATSATLARILRGWASLAEGDAAGALREAGVVEPMAHRRLPNSSTRYLADERFLRALALERLGQERAALAWFETFPEPTAYDVAYAVPARLRVGMLRERLGDARSAAAA